MASTYESLSYETSALLGVICLLKQDEAGIPKELFKASGEQKLLGEKYELSAVLEELLKSDFVKTEETGALIIDEKVRVSFKESREPSERQIDFNNTVKLLKDAFPSEDLAVGQLYTRWGRCSYIEHVLDLKDRFNEEADASKDFKASVEFCGLLIPCQRFLSETSRMTELLSVCETNLRALDMLEDEPRQLDLKASIGSHQAQAAESLGQPLKAVEINMKGYEIRLAEKNNLLLCHTANNIAYCYNTANEHEKALEWFLKSNDWWTASSEEAPKQPPWQLTNRARCLIYLGKYTEAAELLQISITRLQTEAPQNWAMLAFALFVRATLDRREKKLEEAEKHFTEARDVWIKGGKAENHPFYAACIYKIGVCCLEQEKFEEAIKHLGESVEKTKIRIPENVHEHRRALLKYREALAKNSTPLDSLPEAVSLGTEEEHDNLVPIFWR